MPHAKKLTLVFAKRNPGFQAIGSLNSVCPYCSAILSVRPKRKKKCPYCGRPIHVRTRPLDWQNVLVTEDQLSLLEAEWAVYHEVFEAQEIEESDFEQERARLSASWKVAPSNRDVLWSLYNRRLLEYGSKQMWGLYRNTILDMAELERKTGFADHALHFYFFISYLDANGPRNLGPMVHSEPIRSSRPFDPDEGFQAPAVIQLIHDLLLELGLTRQQARSQFVQATDKGMRLPLSPHQAWDKIEPLIWPDPDDSALRLTSRSS